LLKTQRVHRRAAIRKGCIRALGKWEKSAGAPIAWVPPMSEGNHHLTHEFPEYAATIRHLKEQDDHFAQKALAYHETCKELHRIDVGVETPRDEYVEALKLRRLHLKDELFAVLQAHGTGM
jgi:uncharacterized protein